MSEQRRLQRNQPRRFELLDLDPGQPIGEQTQIAVGCLDAREHPLKPALPAGPDSRAPPPVPPCSSPIGRGPPATRPPPASSVTHTPAPPAATRPSSAPTTPAVRPPKPASPSSNTSIPGPPAKATLISS